MTDRRRLPLPTGLRAAGIGAALAATALLATGCSAASAASARSSAPSSSSSERASSSPAAAPGPCHRLHPATLPRSAGSLTQADSGAFCLRVGQRVDVFLTAPAHAAQGTRWQAIGSSSPRVLVPAGNGVMSAPLGVTPGLFVARSAGTSVLTSTFPGGKAWSVTLVVN